MTSTMLQSRFLSRCGSLIHQYLVSVVKITSLRLRRTSTSSSIYFFTISTFYVICFYYTLIAKYTIFFHYFILFAIYSVAVMTGRFEAVKSFPLRVMMISAFALRAV